MTTTWSKEQNGNTGRMIFVDSTLFPSEDYLVDGSGVYNKDLQEGVFGVRFVESGEDVVFEDGDVVFFSGDISDDIWLLEQNGHTGRMIYADNEVIKVDSNSYFDDGSDVFFKTVPPSTISWAREQAGYTGRMVHVDDEVLDVDTKSHFVDGSDVFIKEA
jgi:hypothetical protein